MQLQAGGYNSIISASDRFTDPISVNSILVKTTGSVADTDLNRYISNFCPSLQYLSVPLVTSGVMARAACPSNRKYFQPLVLWLNRGI